ncbi:MAG: hypothetical protein AAB294_03645 [Pseudomonadota bacterium]
MLNKLLKVFFVALMFGLGSATARADVLKPYVLGDTLPGDFNQVVEKVKAALTANGFQVVGTYTPYPKAMAIAATNPELIAAASKAKNGGFGVAQRVAVTEYKGKIQVSYVNPAYLGTAYGLGKLEGVSAKLKTALGATQTFGSKGIEEADLKPGVYRYAMFMPYFNDVDSLNEHKDYKTAVEAVEKNLAAGAGGTVKIYRIDIPGKEISVFGVGIPKGMVDGPENSGNRDTDKEVMDIVDWQDLRHTAFLPYELMVQGNQVIALRGRYRIALHFPDTKMAGEHGFTKIMSAPWGIQVALEAAAGYKRILQ